MYLFNFEVAIQHTVYSHGSLLPIPSKTWVTHQANLRHIGGNVSLGVFRSGPED